MEYSNSYVSLDKRRDGDEEKLERMYYYELHNI